LSNSQYGTHKVSPYSSFPLSSTVRMPSSPQEPRTKKRKNQEGAGSNSNGGDDDNDNDDKIWVDGRYVDRPSSNSGVVTSYGILLYCDARRRLRRPTPSDAEDSAAEYRYLLGLIPQGNAWTVFKGLPSPPSSRRGDGGGGDDDATKTKRGTTAETPSQTAMREFEEETSLRFPFAELKPETTLYGMTSNRRKLLEIYLVKAPGDWTTDGDHSEEPSLPSPPSICRKFDVDKVAKIDSGYMAGRPEIVEIRFLTLRQALGGVQVKVPTTTETAASSTSGAVKAKTAKIYKSQIGILERAEEFLIMKEKQQPQQQQASPSATREMTH